ncbi:EamA family transporter RarD [Paenisporosarcina sp. TG-14]|uniref:EamA family transporter RarD n=1 Tax=Paenisporosarcina sp. TG-14 TaxID=1231057 RepID=UPI00031B0B7A|nr:EamA family transporter RarD [Paenisporosarcina sp. TG-14]
MKLNNEKDGVVFAVLSFMMWGLTPIYWKLTQHISSGEILAQRVFWSFIFMLMLLIFLRKWNLYVKFVKEIIKKPKLFWSLFLASVLISSNWGIFMWAVIEGKIVEVSLGQYINPLTSMLIGVIVLKEKLSSSQVLAFVLAGMGVLTLTLHYGVIPWISLSLALTFGFYGLAKKMIKVDSTIGLALETMLISPIALVFLTYWMFQSQIQFFDSVSTGLLLIGSGAVTVLPLLFFTMSAKKVTLSLIGILQYISPTILLLTGVFLYNETLSQAHLIALIFIWSALAIYTFPSITKRGKKSEVHKKRRPNDQVT